MVRIYNQYEKELIRLSVELRHAINLDEYGNILPEVNEMTDDEFERFRLSISPKDCYTIHDMEIKMRKELNYIHKIH